MLALILALGIGCDDDNPEPTDAGTVDAGETDAGPVDDTIRLNANESPVTALAGRFRRPLNRYPEVRPRGLQALLAHRFGCRDDELLVTRGSSEAIDLVIRTFCRPGVDSVMVPSPSFSMYRHYADIQGARVIEPAAGPDQDFVLDVDSMIGACDADTRLVFLCSPNNPTGTLMPQDDLERLLVARRNSSAIVVDEAYVEFAGVPSAATMLERYPNLLVLRTLSKALGFAGARCGAVIAQAPVIRLLDAVQAPYALSTPVVECVEDALRDSMDAETIVTGIVSERERVSAALQSYDFVHKTWPSSANFVLVQVENAAEVMQHCANSGVLLRHFGGDLSDCIRISIGSREENERLLNALDDLAEQGNG